MICLTSKEADQIADKLGARRKEGRKHELAIVTATNGRLIGTFGIRRSSKAAGHDYIPGQLHITMREAVDLAQCPMSKQRFFELMEERGKI